MTTKNSTLVLGDDAGLDAGGRLVRGTGATLGPAFAPDETRGGFTEPSTKRTVPQRLHVMRTRLPTSFASGTP
jgi:hypothetical protein